MCITHMPNESTEGTYGQKLYTIYNEKMGMSDCFVAYDISIKHWLKATE